MQIFIINLAHEKTRLDYQVKQLGALGLKFERFEALTPDTLPEHVPEKYWQTWERPLRPEERACFLSHRALWQSIAENGQPALILEDDVYLSSRLPDVLNTLDQLGPSPAHYHHFSLEVRNRKKLTATSRQKLFENGHSLRRLYQDRSGAAAYILWPAGAKILLEKTSHKSGLADAILCRTYSLMSWQIEPACALQFDMCKAYNLSAPFETTSATNQSSVQIDLSLPLFLKYKSRRIISQLRMGWRRFSNLIYAERRYIPLDPDNFN